MLNILQLIPTLDRSGAEKQMVILARGLPRDRFRVQVAALTREADAMALANTLRKKNFPTVVQSPHGDKYYHVLVGPYVDQKAVDNARKGLEMAGFKAIVKH